jgi:hypothetical protein
VRRWLIGLTGFLLLVFGFFCLNYTKGDGIEHHREVAREKGLPQPGPGIFYLGVASVGLGAGGVGYAIGTRPSSSALGGR